ncbi:putative 2-dehydropantoate 2-reductase [Pseudomonas sp. Marseille-QA0892]
MNNAPPVSTSLSAPLDGYPWHILGAGSLGGLWAARLFRAGIAVRLILRDTSQRAAYMNVGGIGLTSAGVTHTHSLPAETIDDPTPIRRLLVACKAYDAEPAARSLASWIEPGAEILLLQNGIGSQDAVARALPQARCMAVSSTEGAFRDQPFRVHAAGKGMNWVGDISAGTGRPNALLADLATADIPAQWTEDINHRLWRKLALNCAINPLTVLHDCTNGGLRQHASRVRTLCEELVALLLETPYPTAAHGLLAETERVIDATASNISSMLQDVRAGRRTEISYLLGQACDTAQRLGVPTPHLDETYNQLCLALVARGLPPH